MSPRVLWEEEADAKACVEAHAKACVEAHASTIVTQRRDSARVLAGDDLTLRPRSLAVSLIVADITSAVPAKERSAAHSTLAEDDK